MLDPLLGLFITNSIAILLITLFLLFYPYQIEEEGWVWKVYGILLILALLLYLYSLFLLVFSIK